jgi:hypothetical protein
MKISELIKQIIDEAERKFELTDHLNDCISVSVYFTGADWHVGLQQPTQRQLDNGEIVESRLDTVKQYEYKTAFSAHGLTLVEALRNLQDLVNDTEVWPS